MLIEEYFLTLQQTINNCRVARLSNVTFEKRGVYEGFIKGEISFSDGSILHLREFMDTEQTIEKLMYVYQYLDASQKFIFRYDNTGHHRKLCQATYPHHKHSGADNSIACSAEPDFNSILQEIELLVKLP